MWPKSTIDGSPGRSESPQVDLFASDRSRSGLVVGLLTGVEDRVAGT